MKFYIHGVIFIAVFIAAINGSDKICSKVPTVKVHSCCKLPEIADPKIIEEIATAVEKDKSNSDYLHECKVKAAIFKKFNLVKNDDVDAEAAIKYLEVQLKDPDWKNVMIGAFGMCMNETDTHLAEIQKRSNFTKEQCNLKFDFITECLDLAAFAHCPKSASTESAECNEGKTFVANCHADFDAMEKFIENQHKQ